MISLPVAFMDGTVKDIEVDAQVTGKEMRSIIAKKIGLADQFGFSIFCAVENNVSKQLVQSVRTTDPCNLFVTNMFKKASVSLPSSKEQIASLVSYFCSSIIYLKEPRSNKSIKQLYRKTVKAINIHNIIHNN